MSENQNLPYVPYSSGIEAGSQQIVNITRDADGNTYDLIFPGINASGYLYNDGIGNLDWGAGPQGPKGDTGATGPKGDTGAQGISGTGGGGSGQISFYTGTDATLTLVSNTLVIADPTTTLLNTNDSIFTMPSNGRILYTSASSKYYKVLVNFSGHTLQSNKIVNYHIYKNGSVDVFSVKQHHNNQEYEAIAMSFIVLLNQNDFIELYIEADGNYNYHLSSMTIIIDPC